MGVFLKSSSGGSERLSRPNHSIPSNKNSLRLRGRIDSKVYNKISEKSFYTSLIWFSILKYQSNLKEATIETKQTVWFRNCGNLKSCVGYVVASFPTPQRRIWTLLFHLHTHIFTRLCSHQLSLDA